MDEAHSVAVDLDKAGPNGCRQRRGDLRRASHAAQELHGWPVERGGREDQPSRPGQQSVESLGHELGDLGGNRKQIFCAVRSAGAPKGIDDVDREQRVAARCTLEV